MNDRNRGWDLHFLFDFIFTKGNGYEHEMKSGKDHGSPALEWLLWLKDQTFLQFS